MHQAKSKNDGLAYWNYASQQIFLIATIMRLALKHVHLQISCHCTMTGILVLPFKLKLILFQYWCSYKVQLKRPIIESSARSFGKRSFAVYLRHHLKNMLMFSSSILLVLNWDKFLWPFGGEFYVHVSV